MELSILNPFSRAKDYQMPDGNSLLLNERVQVTDPENGKFINTKKNMDYRQLADKYYGTDRLYWVIHFSNPGLILEPFDVLPENNAVFIPDLELAIK